MKKLTLLLSLITTLSYSQHLAVKTFAKDTSIDLKSRIKVTQMTIDAKSQSITYIYVIETLAPKGGGVINCSDPKSYIRSNVTRIDPNTGLPVVQKTNFDKFMNSATGAALATTIQNDINLINKVSETNLLEQ